MYREKIGMSWTLDMYNSQVDEQTDYGNNSFETANSANCGHYYSSQPINNTIINNTKRMFRNKKTSIWLQL